MSRRAGVTRIEAVLLASLAIVAVGLVAVGISRIREIANLASCQNTLKQLGLAVQNYDSTFNRLPPLADQGVGSSTGRGLPSAFALLIPYLEAMPYGFYWQGSADLYNAHSSVHFPYHDKQGNEDWQIGGAANNSWIRFIDPSDATADKLQDVPMTLPDGTTGYYATGSYAANGLIPWGTGNLKTSFPRGAENTVLMGEKPQVCRSGTGEVVYNLWGLGFYSPHMPAFACLTPVDPPGLQSTGQVAPVKPFPSALSDHRDDHICVRVGWENAAMMSPDFPTPVQRIRSNGPCDPRLPGGPHASGLQVLMADASVRVFAWDTSPWLFWSACLPIQPAEE